MESDPHPARRLKIQAYMETIPILRRELYRRTMFESKNPDSQQRASPRQVIKAKCHDCMGYEDLVHRIGGCTVYTCPLWNLRPYQDKGVKP